MMNLHAFTKKLTVTGTFLLALLCPAYTDTTFSGFTGIVANFNSNPEKDSFETQMNAETFLSGQIHLSDRIFARGEFSIQTDNILKNGITDSTDSKFRIDELSVTWEAPLYGKYQHFSLFTGIFEPIGSDLFLQRYFGIKPFNSLILENYRGLAGANVYNIEGTGGSYILKMDTIPLAAGLYVYKNRNNTWDEGRLNLDLRAGSVMKYLAIDADGGVEIPVNIDTNGEQALLVVDTLYFHSGVNALIGNRYSWSMLMQGGFKNLPIKGNDNEKKINSKDIYLLVEPRVRTTRFQASLGIFSLPQDCVEKLLFIDDKDEQGKFTNTMGVNLTIHTDTLYLGNKNYTFGFHVTGTFPGKDFMDVKDYKSFIEDEYVVKVCPFVGIPLLSGTLKGMIQSNITEFKDKNWRHAVKLNIGYKSVL